MAIDERRRPFAEYRFAGEGLADRDIAEMWFAGVHSDIGGHSSDESHLPDIAFAWMVDEADAAGLSVDTNAYRRALGVKFGSPLPLNARSDRSGTTTRCGDWRVDGGYAPSRPAVTYIPACTPESPQRRIPLRPIGFRTSADQSSPRRTSGRITHDHCDDAATSSSKASGCAHAIGVAEPACQRGSTVVGVYSLSAGAGTFILGPLCAHRTSFTRSFC